jgi:surface polysaccharide O-acyltransferase-like enzyme
MAETGKAKSRDYRQVIDLLRFLAAMGIVMDHTMGWVYVGYPALGLFLILTSYFAVGSYQRTGGDHFWTSRAQRILIPWLFWCAVYRVVWEFVSDAPFHVLTDPFTLLIGPSIHLWFLPFVAIALVLIPLIARDVATERQLIVASIVLVPLSVILGLIHAKAGLEGWLVAGSPMPQPVPQWAFSLPIFMWGALAAVAHRLGQTQITLLSAAVGSLGLAVLDWDYASFQLILCAVVFEICYRMTLKGDWMTHLASYAFGIYLMHPFFLLAGYKVFGAGMPAFTGFLVAFFGSWAATWVFKRVPVLRTVV